MVGMRRADGFRPISALWRAAPAKRLEVWRPLESGPHACVHCGDLHT